MDSTQSFKDCINLGDLDRDEHPELAGLIEKYEQKLDPDELQELAELVNMIDAYRFERRCQIEDHDNFVDRMIMFEQCGQDIQLEPGPLPGTFRSDVNHGQLFRFFGSVTEIRTHNHSDTDRVLVELDVYIPWDLWRQGIDIRGGDKFELVRTFRSLRQDELTYMGF
ncbi:hypothetical protein ACRE_074570 [Hapsidospora chrysogenum ATCC 11550]|uniref:Uncharacterized protein n=1 Tax=Hapsidospora chrysogenum (strain ATCC 11550 / CBS 779.69 / DSM 880 / IAM 14645 / JCM 23072 / IMI 49137) TaxID=857340 RepID=A0A086SXJ7_HAPC1|nr:hypothetical protein ACRE_074570 [Hapsidospora chrysogenum ATCC 11550]